MTSAGYKQLRLCLIALFLIVLGVLIAMLTVAGPPLWLLLILGLIGLLLVVTVCWHARVTHYTCSSCQHVFRVSPVTDFISPHVPDQKLLSCPKCGAVGWCQETA